MRHQPRSERQGTAPTAPERRRIRDWLLELTPIQIWALLGSLGGAMAIAFALGYKTAAHFDDLEAKRVATLHLVELGQERAKAQRPNPESSPEKSRNEESDSPKNYEFRISKIRPGRHTSLAARFRIHVSVNGNWLALPQQHAWFDIEHAVGEWYPFSSAGKRGRLDGMVIYRNKDEVGLLKPDNAPYAEVVFGDGPHGQYLSVVGGDLDSARLSIEVRGR